MVIYRDRGAKTLMIIAFASIRLAIAPLLRPSDRATFGVPRAPTGRLAPIRRGATGATGAIAGFLLVSRYIGMGATGAQKAFGWTQKQVAQSGHVTLRTQGQGGRSTTERTPVRGRRYPAAAPCAPTHPGGA